MSGALQVVGLAQVPQTHFPLQQISPFLQAETHWPFCGSQTWHLFGSHASARQVLPQTFAFGQQIPSPVGAFRHCATVVPPTVVSQQTPGFPSVPLQQVPPAAQTTHWPFCGSQVSHLLGSHAVARQV